MIPSDHFVRFYNEVFKFLDEKGGLRSFYDEISRHQELHCLELFRSKGIRGVYEYYQKIYKEENCEGELIFNDRELILRMDRCPSLAKALDNDAGASPKYCLHCSGWSGPLATRCGLYYVQNMVSPSEPRCQSVRTESKQAAEEMVRKFLDEGVPPDMIHSNLADWEEVEENKKYRKHHDPE